MPDREQGPGAWGVPLEVVAAITAALSVVLEPGSFSVGAIRPVSAPAAAAPGWAKAGVLEQQLTRRGVYLWGRRTR